MHLDDTIKIAQILVQIWCDKFDEMCQCKAETHPNQMNVYLMLKFYMPSDP